MYPGTIVNYIDNSYIVPEQDALDTTERPLFMLVSSFDKGPEDLRVVVGNKFYELYGDTMSFARHGQGPLQSKLIIDNGGALLVKRIVADDATLSNIVLLANVVQGSDTVQKTNSLGDLLYYDEDGNETTVADGNTPIMINVVDITWSVETITGAKTFEDVKDAALALATENTFPVFFITNVGRGDSPKAVRFVPDYVTSKGLGDLFYEIKIYEGTNEIESKVYTLNPDVIYDGEAYRIDKSSFSTAEALVDEATYANFVNAVWEAAGTDNVSLKEIVSSDLLNGYTIRGEECPYLHITDGSINMNTDYGVDFQSGDNGEFGDAPVNSEEWIQKIVDVYSGDWSDDVWDVDKYHLFAILDADYPRVIKDAIANFVNFRQDCFYFRDLGTTVSSFLEIKEAKKSLEINSMFMGTYSTTYLIQDPETLKRERVTMMYDLAEKLTQHYLGNPFSPIAGIYNGFTLDHAIEGTINYVPIIKPKANMKAAMDDLRVNYAIFENGRCVVQSLYTDNGINTQLQYINNMLSMQEIARQIRTVCPEARYAISADGANFSNYNNLINGVLEKYQGNFKVLELVYTADKRRAAQKIYYAGINFQFADWAQTELFDLVAMPVDVNS